MRSCVFLVSLFLLTGSGLAQISVDGVADKKVYKDRVSLVVHSEAGFEYAATLNGVRIATDLSVEVNEPQYYELMVERRRLPSGVEESELIRFIVRASERGNTEWGLPVWTPYPSIPSSSAEFAGARLEMVTPAEYPLGLDIPIVARVEDESGAGVRVNGVVTAGEFPDYALELIRGVGSVFLPAAAEPGVLTYDAEIHSLQAPKQIEIEAATVWQTVSADIVTSVDWGENARIRVRGAADGVLTVATDVMLTIGAGSVVVLDAGTAVAVEGHIAVNGTNARPVVFTAEDRSKPWGGFLFESSACSGQFTDAIFTASGADSNWFSHNPGHGRSHRSEQCLFYVSNRVHVTLTDCFLVENQGQAGHGENAYLTMTGCLIQKCITCGQYNGGAVTATDCAFIEFPSATASFVDGDNDALYLSGGAHAFTDCLIGWTLDDGIDAGDGAEGPVTVDRCWFESTYHEGMAWSSGPRYATVTDTVVLNCGQGIECGYGDPDVNAVRCLATANLVGARFGDNYDWAYRGFLKVSQSLLLFNWRDVWGRAWDNWTVHLAQMDIQDNYLSVPNANYPDNLLWDPNTDPNQLDWLMPFLPTAASTVGIGLAVCEDILGLSELSGSIPVRLSSFTTEPVCVDYAIDADNECLAAGTLCFVPGETLKHIQFGLPPIEAVQVVDVSLSNPINAELTGYSTVTYHSASAEPPVLAGDR